jgi:hypothetical protein
VLSLIGLYYFLEIDRLHVLAWILTITLCLVLSVNKILPVVDSLRLMEFLYIPLAIIAAFGITRITRLPRILKLFPLVLAVFVVICLVTSFPPVVFLEKSFEPGHPLFDTRSWVIQHKSSEISTLSWLNDSRARGFVETDAYVGYAARGIILTDGLKIQSIYPFQRAQYNSPVSDISSHQHYLLVLSRMKDYTEFGVQWMQKREPLNDADFRKINEECNILYTNGNAEVYLFFSNVTSEYYFYYCRDNGCPAIG